MPLSPLRELRRRHGRKPRRRPSPSLNHSQSTPLRRQTSFSPSISVRWQCLHLLKFDELPPGLARRAVAPSHLSRRSCCCSGSTPLPSSWQRSTRRCCFSRNRRGPPLKNRRKTSRLGFSIRRRAWGSSFYSSAKGSPPPPLSWSWAEQGSWPWSDVVALSLVGIVLFAVVLRSHRGSKSLPSPAVVAISWQRSPPSFSSARWSRAGAPSQLKLRLNKTGGIMEEEKVEAEAYLVWSLAAAMGSPISLSREVLSVEWGRNVEDGRIKAKCTKEEMKDFVV